MQIIGSIEPCEGKAGDVVILRVQLTDTEEQIKSVYARTDEDSWQLNKEKKNQYTLSMQIPPFISPGTYDIHIFAENEKGEKIVEATVPFLLKDEELEEEPGFSTASHVIQELESARLNTVLKKTPHLLKRVENYVLSIRVAKRLLSSQTYQASLFVRKDPGVNRSLVPKKRLSRLRKTLSDGAERIDLKSLSEGNLLKFEKSIEASLEQLKPIRAFAKEYTLHLTANAHIDLAWLWRWKETVQICHDTFSSVLEKMQKYPFTFTQSQAQAYEWIEERYPHLFREIQKAVRQGKWEIVGGMWAEPDCNLIDGESWVRQILYAKKYFKEKFAQDARIGWNVDSFGYNWNMPQIYKKSGFNFFVTQKIEWNDTNLFPFHLFWWQGPDGSRILTYLPYERYNFTIKPYRFIDILKQFELNTGLKDMMILFGIGDHGGGPTEEILLEAEKLKDIFIYPKVEYGTAEEYFSRITKEMDMNTLPVWKDELYLEYHRGTYTTQAKAKYNNRKSEVLLIDAEKICALATLCRSASYPKKRLAEAWKKVMFNQFHDILPGSSIRSVYQDSEEDYARVKKIGKNIIEESLHKISSRIDTSGVPGQPVVVFNSLFWPREEIIAIPRPANKDFVVRDSEAKRCLCQEVEAENSLIGPGSKEKKSLLLCKVKLPSFGYTTLFIEERKEAKGKIAEQNKEQLKVDKYSLENEFFKVEINPASGNLASIYDKRKEREVLSDEGNQLQILEEDKLKSHAWNIAYTGKKWSLNSLESIEIIEEGPLRGVIRVRRSFLGDTKLNVFWDAPARNYPSSFFVQDIILYQGIPRIDFVTRVDWWEDNKLLKLVFPVRVKSKYATYEIPFGSILRPTTEDNSWEKARFEVPALRWADLSQGDYGVALLNNSKHGYDIHKSTIRLTLLRSPASDALKSSSVPDPLADRGKHTIRYSLVPHAGNWKEALVYRNAYEFNFNPYIKSIKLQQENKKNEPGEKSFLKIGPDNVLLTAFKQCEEEPECFILRVYEAWGEKSTVKIELPVKPKRVFKTNLLEEPEEEIKLGEKEMKIDIGAYEIITLRIYPG